MNGQCQSYHTTPYVLTSVFGTLVSILHTYQKLSIYLKFQCIHVVLGHLYTYLKAVDRFTSYLLSVFTMCSEFQ